MNISSRSISSIDTNNMSQVNPAILSFYLPQFHRIPENDAWWGEGFTEWTNVRKAASLFPGHNQPRSPGTLGYYDLTNPSDRMSQADLARDHGVDGFCYWHYWFGNGVKILERPFAEVVASGKPDFPFCVCWANQSWTGVWHGAPKRVLMEQTYPGTEDEEAHFRYLLPAFRDQRYIRVDGKPIFVVYAPNELPDANAFADRWRTRAIDAGLPGMFMIGMSNIYHSRHLPSFDRVMPFGPGDFLDRRPLSKIKKLLRRMAAHPAGSALGDTLRYRLNAPLHYQYRDVVATALDHLVDDPLAIPCVIPGWDNTPRSGRRGIVFEGATPALFEAYLRKAIRIAEQSKAGPALVFIKAWNEWAEGNMLEPARDTGNSFLEAVLRAKTR